MEISISEQLMSCAAHLVLGVLSAVLYDVFRLIYLSIKPSNSNWQLTRLCFNISIIILDILYCIAVTVAFSVTSFAFSYGKLRVFNLFCFGVGFTVYMITVSRVSMFVLAWVIYGIKLAFKLIIKLMLIPIGFFLRLIMALVMLLYRVTISKLFTYVKVKKQKKYFNVVLNQLKTDVRIG